MLDTSAVAPQEREDTIREALWASFSRVDINHHAAPEGIGARMGVGSVGPIKVCSARATPVTLRRTERLARQDEEPAVFLGLQVAGTNLVGQYDRQGLIEPGSLVVFESSAPYTLSFEDRFAYHSLRIPRRALALPTRVIRDVSAIPLGPENPTARLAFTYFSQLAVSEELRDRRFSEAIIGPSVELLRALVTSHSGGTGRSPAQAPLTLRIVHYLRTHLADPDLSAHQVAAACGISVRYLYIVLARSGISLGDWIRAQRLAECKRELADPGSRRRTIAGIGRKWGFVNAAHFSTSFKRAYGISPRDWRDQCRPLPPA